MHNPTHGLVKAGETYFEKVPVGSKIKFAKEKRRYTVQASNRFYSVCTKPQNVVKRRGKSGIVEKTVMYTVIDWHHQTRGTENLVFGMGAETRLECEEMLHRLTNGSSDISHRNWCPLDIEKVETPKDAKAWQDIGTFIAADNIKKGDMVEICEGKAYKAISTDEAVAQAEKINKKRKS